MAACYALLALMVVGATVVPQHATSPPTTTYLAPGTAKEVTISKTGSAETQITVLTEAVAVKETGPKATVARFGEVYAFSPAVVLVHRGQPTRITFWNLQPDDEHDFVLMDPHFKVLMKTTLAPLSKTSYIFTFRKEGLFPFSCTLHQPEMNGQILVLPPASP